MARWLGNFSRIEKTIAAAATGLVTACVILTSADISGLLLNTLKLAIAIMAVSVPVSATLAVCLSRRNVGGERFWHGCLLVLLFVPLFIQLAAWEAGFGRGGWYSTLVSETLSNPPLEGFWGATWVHAAAAIPWLFWILRLGFLSVPRTYEQAASIDATPWQVFRRVTFPLLLPVAMAGCLYVLIIASTEITITDRYQYRSYAEVLYSEFVLNDRFDELPLSIAPILVTLVSVTVAGLALCKLLVPHLRQLTVDRAANSEAKSIDWVATAIVGGVTSWLLFFPIGNLFYQAGIDVVVSEAGERVRTWSFSKMLQLVSGSPWEYREELAYSAIMSQISVVGTIISATLLAWWARGRVVREFVAAMLATVCFVLPGPFIGLGLIWALNRDSAFLAWLYDDTLFAPCLAIAIRCFPFVYLIIWYGLNGVATSVSDAASTDGATRWQTLWHVVIPSLWPNFICAGLVGLAISLGELCASILVMPPGVTTVATQIFQLIHYGAEDQLAGLCLSCLAVFVAIAVVAGVALRRLVARTAIAS